MEPNKVDKFVSDTIEQYFPELRKSKVNIVFRAKTDFYMAIAWKISHYELVIDKSALKFSEAAFKGCLAHELAHIADLNKSNIVNRIRKMFFTGESTAEERATDLEVIRRGLGKELLQFHEEHNKRFKSYKESDGLTKREIKRFLKPR